MIDLLSKMYHITSCFKPRKCPQIASYFTWIEFDLVYITGIYSGFTKAIELDWAIPSYNLSRSER